MPAVHYFSGEEVHIGDIVDVGCGNGPKATVVVIIPTDEAALGFIASEWAYLQSGVMLQDNTLFGLLHLSELDHELVLVQRAQPALQADRR